MRLCPALTLLSLLVLPAAVASADEIACDTAQNMVQDCSFEYGLTWWQTDGNWDVNNNAVTSFIAHSGTYSLKDGNYPSQGVAGVWNYITDTPGEAYTLSFWLYLDADNSGGGDQQYYLVGWGQQGLLVESNQPMSTQWTQYTYTVVGTGSDILQFSGYSNHGYNYLDDISLTPVSDSTPEPATLALFLCGLVALAARIRRRVVGPRGALPSGLLLPGRVG